MFSPPRMTMSLIRPTMLHVAVVGHHREVAGVHPPVGVDRLGGARSGRSSSPASPSSRGCTTRRSRRARASSPVAGSTMRTSTWGCTRPTVAVRWCDRVVGQGLGRHRRRLGHPVADRHLGHVHPVDARRITSTGHGEPAMTPVRSDDRSKSREAGCAELGDEHRRHAVQRGAPLGLHRLEHVRRVERVGGDHHRRPVRGAAEVAHAPCRSSGRTAPGCTAGRPA